MALSHNSGTLEMGDKIGRRMGAEVHLNWLTQDLVVVLLRVTS